jgi:hypothetical protein
MVVYNVTVSIDEGIANEWLEWMRATHIPDVMETGHFKESRLCRVHGEEEGGVTYAIIYVAHSEVSLNEYQEKHAPRLQAEHSEKFAGKFAAFRTLLSVIDEFKK